MFTLHGYDEKFYNLNFFKLKKILKSVKPDFKEQTLSLSLSLSLSLYIYIYIYIYIYTHH